MPRGAWIAIGALAAACAATQVVSPTARAVVAAVALAMGLVAIMLVARRRPRAAALAVGIASIGLRLVLANLTAPVIVPPPGVPTDGQWSAQVQSLGSTADAQQRAVIVADAMAGSASGPRGPWRVYAWLPRYPALLPTDRITFTGTLEPVHRDGSTFADYLESIDVAATVRIRSLSVLPPSGDPFGLVERIRGATDAALARVLPEPMAGLASGILIGRQDRVSRDVTDDFKTTGLSHVVAISGWNICLVGAVIGGLLRAMGLSRRSRTLAIVVALCGFTLLAGGGASVVRAALMGGVALVAREAGRPGTAAAALGLAVWSLLLIDPAIVGDVGFQLSVSATAGLLAWGSRLTHRLRGPDPGRGRRWLAESMGVSLAAQAATLPLVLFHFGRLSLIAPVANLVMAPLVAPAMLVGTIALVAGFLVGAGVPFVFGAPFATLGWLVLGSMVTVAGTFARVPMASLELPPTMALLLAVCTTVAIGAVASRAGPEALPLKRQPGTPVSTRPPPRTIRAPRRPSRVLAVGLAAVAAVAGMGLVLWPGSGPGRLAVTVLDVGQGDSILVEGPRGGRMLLDSGPDPDRLLTVLDRHVPAWDRRIDLVILTHPHEDHVAGLAMLLSRYRVGAIAENGMLGAGPGDVAFRSWLRATGFSTRRLSAGDRLSVDRVPVVVRWPVAAEVPVRSPSVGRAVNDTSVVLDIRYGERRMLLTGDIEDDVDPRLLSGGIGGPADARLDVLKVAHHGSRTATSQAWLDALRPRIAMISAGTGNPYGHPAPETVERLEASGARVLRTDLDGDLVVSTDGHDLRTSTTGGRPIGASSRATVAATAIAAAYPGTSILTSPFLCAIPLSAAGLGRLPPPPPRHPSTGRPIPPPSAPLPVSHHAMAVEGILPGACYDLADDGALQRGRGRTLPDPDPQRTAVSARVGRGGRRLLPGHRDASRGPPGRSGAGGGRGTAA